MYKQIKQFRRLLKESTLADEERIKQLAREGDRDAIEEYLRLKERLGLPFDKKEELKMLGILVGFKTTPTNPIILSMEANRTRSLSPILYWRLYRESGGDINDALRQASMNNNFELVNLLLGRGATDLNGALYEAAFWNHFEMVKFLVESGAYKFDRALRQAFKNENQEMIEYLQNVIAQRRAVSKGKVRQFHRPKIAPKQ